MQVREKIFPADIEMLTYMMKWVRDRIREAGFSETHGKKLEVALEEALVNIIHYAYQHKKGKIDLQCFCYLDRVEFKIKDQGFPFNPLLLNPDFEGLSNTPLEERQEGGLGIFLIRQYMDDIRYERNESYNILTLIKKIV